MNPTSSSPISLSFTTVKDTRSHTNNELSPPPYETSVQTYQDESQINSTAINAGDPLLTFSDTSIRRGFIRKVFGILLIQITFTFGLSVIVTFTPTVNRFVTGDDGGGLQYPLIYTAAGLVPFLVIVIIVMIVKPQFLKIVPVNYVALLLVTFVTTFIVAITTANFGAKLETLYVTGMTLALTFSIILFSFQSKYELGMLNGFGLSIVSLALAGLILYFSTPDNETLTFMSNKPLFLGLLGLVALFIGMLWVAIVVGIVSDTKSFKKSNGFSPEDYVLGAMIIYISVILIFLLLLLLFASGNGNSNACRGGPFIGRCFWFAPCMFRGKDNDDDLAEYQERYSSSRQNQESDLPYNASHVGEN